MCESDERLGPGTAAHPIENGARTDAVLLRQKQRLLKPTIFATYNRGAQADFRKISMLVEVGSGQDLP